MIHGIERTARRLRFGGLLAVLMTATACDERSELPMTVAGGDPARGALLIRGYGCGSCHTIPEIAGANANVGPPLTEMARQAYIAGVLPNLPDELVRWIQDPQAIDPRSAMPDLGVDEAAARDIAAYLYAIEDGQQ